MGDLSKYFSRYEMACKCGCGLDTMDIETLRIADEVREFVGVSITPGSAARCFVYNRSNAVGSNDNSQHPRCRAMDLPVPNPRKVYKWLCDKYPGQYGFGLYATFVHIDTRTDGPARWDKT